MKGYFYIYAISAIIGIGVALSNIYLIFVVYLIWLIYLYVFSRIKKKIVFLAISTFFLFFYYYLQETPLKIDEEDLERTEFIGEIVTPLQMTDQKYEFTFYDEQIEANLLAILFKDEKVLNDDNKKINQLQYGATCQLKGTLKI